MQLEVNGVASWLAAPARADEGKRERERGEQRMRRAPANKFHRLLNRDSVPGFYPIPMNPAKYPVPVALPSTCYRPITKYSLLILETVVE